MRTGYGSNSPYPANGRHSPVVWSPRSSGDVEALPEVTVTEIIVTRAL